jgi:tetratricopeptide (TPR) repeat protein
LALLAIATLIAVRATAASASDDLAMQLKTATALHRQGDYAHAIPLLKQIVQSSPRSYMANLLLGEDLLHSGSVQASLGPLRVASQAKADDGAAEAYLAEAATALGNFSLAAEAQQSAVARSGGAAEFVVAWAGYCIDRFRVLEMALRTTKQGEGVELRVEAWSRPPDDEVRETLLEQSAAADPEQRGIWGELGIEQLELGKTGLAQESLKQAETRDPLGAETLQLAALVAAGDQNWRAAEDKLLALGERSPGELLGALAAWPATRVPGPEVSGVVWSCLRSGIASCPLVKAHPQGGGNLSAQQLYAQGRWEQLKALGPFNDASESLWRGVALARTGECPRAIPALERGFNSDHLTAGFWLEICYAGELGNAESMLKAAGQDTALHELMGDVALRLRSDATTAVSEYTEALESRQKDPELLASLAEAYKLAGDTAHARNAAQAALEASPRNRSALITLSQMAMNERDYAEALVRLKQLAVIQPMNGWVQVELGIAYGQLGQPAEAVRRLGPQLASGYPDHKGALHAQLASALRKLGRDDEARKAAAEAARLANLSLASDQGDADAPR